MAKQSLSRENELQGPSDSDAVQSYNQKGQLRQSRLRLCITCGAVITESTTAMHNRWHDELKAAIDANRPDPRSAFIGG